MGSRNGTILNNERISTSKRESSPKDIVHGSVLQVALTKLLCHIHNGNTTCGHCEPGLVGTFAENTFSKTVEPTFTHKEGLKMLQKRYGLENESV
jgi:pSer/pThr/pTyr-binding forkhead associated (FHA) protein